MDGLVNLTLYRAARDRNLILHKFEDVDQQECWRGFWGGREPSAFCTKIYRFLIIIFLVLHALKVTPTEILVTRLPLYIFQRSLLID